MGRYFGSLGKDSSEMPALFDTLANGRLNDLVSDISPQPCSKQHHGALGKNRSVRILDVEAHFLGVNRKPFGGFGHRGYCCAGRLDYGGNNRPFRLPSADTT